MSTIISDLLAKGKTSGQAMRLLVDPVKRMYEIKAEEEAAEKEREAKQNSKVNMLLQQKGQWGQGVKRSLRNI